MVVSAVMTRKRSELAAILDKVARNYPHGIPQNAIATPAILSTPSCTFLLVHDSESIRETHAELIDAICTKGLKLDRTLCHVRVISDSDRDWGGSSSPITLVLGSSRAPGTIETIGGATCLFSHSIEEIASNPGSKREFWGHLQALLRT